MWYYKERDELKWTDNISNEVALNRVDKERSILIGYHRRIANYIGHMLTRTMCYRGYRTPSGKTGVNPWTLKKKNIVNT